MKKSIHEIAAEVIRSAGKPLSAHEIHQAMFACSRTERLLPNCVPSESTQTLMQSGRSGLIDDL